MRLDGKGLIDRSKPVSFTFDGIPMRGYVGDTLASALLANDTKLVARSFKYHRPRGVLTAGSEEPNALVTIGSDAVQEPNVRATMQELYEGLEAYSQNRWPSLGWDLMSVNDLAAPFLGAGFYYKTFMWPRAFWEQVYEPLIRRAAGLGAISGAHNPDKYDSAYAFCDLLVIGAGPTGLMAALTAARAGADVILADEDGRMGGRLLSETEEVAGMTGTAWTDSVLAELSAMENVRLMARTTVTGAYDQGSFGALERVGHHIQHRDPGAPLETFWRIVAKRAVLAAGALDRPVAFRNNDRPGIMVASAVRTYVNRFGVAPGRSVMVFGNTDDAHRTARDLLAADVHVAGVVDARADAPIKRGYRTYASAMIANSRGRRALDSVLLRTPSGAEWLKADCLAVSGGWNPTVHLTCHMNGRPVWRDAIAGFVPAEDAVPGLIPAGACNGVFSTAGCLRAGANAAVAALEQLGQRARAPDMPEAEDDPYRIAPIWLVPGKGRAWLDFQNDVTVKDVKQAAQENYRAVEHMKRYTTQGMATDQGKNSNVPALAILADATGRSIPETGTTTFRPPYSPVAIAALGAGAQGKGFAPERFTPSHQASVDMGAPMIEAGLWYRPSYFPHAGEHTWHESCDREVGYVREAVGICDVSTLGKIDIQGPDAAQFLDFVYTNTFSTLKPGRVRYGLMLREDGHVMDDGTTARLSDSHFVMTTTTAAAGQVMIHLDWVQQALKPNLDVSFISVTEQWAQFAIAGPKSRVLLNDLLDTPIDNDSVPFMGCGPVSVLGVAGRLFRISFSGEHAYELAVPSRYGDSLFRMLVKRAEAMGGGAYGIEALNVLRIEKGFVTHAEIHGRITAFDIGMGRMVSAKKDCVGKTMSQRPGLLDPEREQLVGLSPIGSRKKITAGAHLFISDDPATRENDQGYVTSVAYSRALGQMIGLGFLRNGANRHGEIVRMVDHLRGVETRCVVQAPVFFDKQGARVHG